MASRPIPRNNDFKNSYALVVGINDYREGIKPLRTAVNDAEKLASLLESEHQYNVTLLTSKHNTVSKQYIQTALTEGFQQVGKRDRFLFYFAGHGIALEGDDGPEGYIVPQDANGVDRDSLLPMTDLHEWLTALPCRHMLAILDCCFAGAIRWSFGRSGGFQGVDVIHKERYERYIRSKAWQVLTSAAHNQEALDVVSGQTIGARETGMGEHSPFANALIHGLAGAADLIPKDGGDGVITASELALYLRDEVETEAKEAAAHTQTPMLWKLKQHEHGEFVFVAGDDQATMKRIMLRMVAVDGSQTTRRRVRRDELIYPDETENEQVNAILTQLQVERLIVMDGDFIELAHDALVTAWDQLVIWRREAMKTYLPLQRRVATASHDWHIGIHLTNVGYEATEKNKQFINKRDNEQ